MKRTVVLLCAALLAAGSVWAQELSVSGEARTGFYMEQEKIGDNKAVANGGATNNDGESGGGAGRLRMDFDFAYENLGLRVRFQVEPATGYTGDFSPKWSYAYAYGNLFNEQLCISAGILGNSPWGTLGYRLPSEPETRQYKETNGLSGDLYTESGGLIGIRFEYKPVFIPGLNIGFVLNQPDQTPIDVMKQSFGDVLGESVIGVAYEHDLFAVRVGYRFDSKADNISDTQEGARLNYSLEARFLESLGMKLWLDGEYFGIGCEKRNIQGRGSLGVGEQFINWLYWIWDTDNFIAQFDACFAIYQAYNNNLYPSFNLPGERKEYQSIEVFPAYYHKFFNNLLQVGLRLGGGMEMGDGKTYIDSSYQYFMVEPQIRLNMSNNAYIAAVYNYTNKYAPHWLSTVEFPINAGDKSTKHFINIRAVYTF